MNPLSSSHVNQTFFPSAYAPVVSNTQSEGSNVADLSQRVSLMNIERVDFSGFNTNLEATARVHHQAQSTFAPEAILQSPIKEIAEEKEGTPMKRLRQEVLEETEMSSPIAGECSLRVEGLFSRSQSVTSSPLSTPHTVEMSSMFSFLSSPASVIQPVGMATETYDQILIAPQGFSNTISRNVDELATAQVRASWEGAVNPPAILLEHKEAADAFILKLPEEVAQLISTMDNDDYALYFSHGYHQDQRTYLDEDKFEPIARDIRLIANEYKKHIERLKSDPILIKKIEDEFDERFAPLVNFCNRRIRWDAYASRFYEWKRLDRPYNREYKVQTARLTNPFNNKAWDEFEQLTLSKESSQRSRSLNENFFLRFMQKTFDRMLKKGLIVAFNIIEDFHSRITP